jgi:hypothetical protein
VRRQREGKNTILENKTDELEGLQDFFNQKSHSEIEKLFVDLRNTAPCCDPVAFDDDFDLLLNNLQQNSRKNELYFILTAAFDQYVVFGLNEIAEKNIIILSRFFGFLSEASKSPQEIDPLLA